MSYIKLLSSTKSFIFKKQIYLKSNISHELAGSLSIAIRKYQTEQPGSEKTSNTKSESNTTGTTDTNAGAGFTSEEEIREKILKNSLKYIPQYGFSMKALIEGKINHRIHKLINYLFNNQFKVLLKLV